MQGNIQYIFWHLHAESIPQWGWTAIYPTNNPNLANATVMMFLSWHLEIGLSYLFHHCLPGESGHWVPGQQPNHRLYFCNLGTDTSLSTQYLFGSTHNILSIIKRRFADQFNSTHDKMLNFYFFKQWLFLQWQPFLCCCSSSANFGLKAFGFLSNIDAIALDLWTTCATLLWQEMQLHLFGEQ